MFSKKENGANVLSKDAILKYLFLKLKGGTGFCERNNLFLN